MKPKYIALLVFILVTNTAAASIVAVPEIDGGHIGMSVALLAAIVSLWREHYKK